MSLEHWTIKNGDALSELKKLGSEEVQTVVTSPPYWGLRDYGTGTWEGGSETCDHIEGASRNDTDREFGTGDVVVEYYKDTCPKCGAIRHDSQLGAEDTYQEYVDNMVEVFREVRRVLKNDGTLWLNLGDSYMSAYNTSPPPQTVGGQRGMPTSVPGNRKKQTGVKHKDLVGIPWRVALALQEDGWWLRSDIIWSKPNPMPESVKDRPTKSHEYIFLLTKSPHYYYDADAIREPHTWGESKPRPSGMERNAQKYRDKVYGGGGSGFAGHSGTRKADGSSLNHPLGKNKRTVWTEDDKNIKGNMSERGVTRTTEGLNLKTSDEKRHPFGKNKRSVWTVNTKPYPEAHFAVYPEKLVKDCVLAGSKDEDLVLDPFSGSGTTGLVAYKNNRNYIGIELSEDYAQLSMRRLASEVGATEEQSKLIKTDGGQSGLFL